MIAQVERYWDAPGPLRIPAPRRVETAKGLFERYDALERAQLLSLLRESEALHAALRELLQRLDRIASPEPDPREIAPTPGPSLFLWGDPEALRGTLVSLLIFWTGLLLWIYVNPPMGYTVAALALALSLIILFTPVNPLQLILVYSFSFLFSFLSYVFLLPHLHEWWELALYIFGYMFLAYYLIPVPVALFFAMGLIFQFIDNSMVFSFQLFVTVLLVFYLFLGLLLLFNYLPIPNRPESLFRQLEARFRRQVRRLLKPGGGWGRRHASAHLPVTLARMKLWSSQLDTRYFDRVDTEALQTYLGEGERVVTLLTAVADQERRVAGSALMKALRAEASGGEIERTLRESLEAGVLARQDSLVRRVVRELERRIASVRWEGHPMEEIAAVAQYLTLKKLLWESLFRAETLRERIGLEQLKWSRF
jgi:hypothetical protein